MKYLLIAIFVTFLFFFLFAFANVSINIKQWPQGDRNVCVVLWAVTIATIAYIKFVRDDMMDI